MKLYHYATWGGKHILKTGLIVPSTSYTWGPETLATPQWSPLVFFTENPIWEPSVQAKPENGFWEKCGSDPDSYNQLGIPCWKFTVEDERIMHITAVAGSLKWHEMLEDARLLGSDTDQWYVSGDVIEITNYEPLNSVAEHICSSA